MNPRSTIPVLLPFLLAAVAAAHGPDPHGDGPPPGEPITYGPRPFFLVDDMRPSPLKAKLASCAHQRPSSTSFSVAHRGALLQFPEYTKEAFLAAARMGAGKLICDASFTYDKKLVCRVRPCGLHSTTNILLTPLNATCRKPFRPATADRPASASCCLFDITLKQFKSLTGKMDGVDTTATTVEDFVRGGVAPFRTQLYSSSLRTGTVMSLREALRLFKRLGVQMGLNLNTPPEMPFRGLTRDMYAQLLIDDVRAEGVSPERVWPSSFHWRDIKYWLRNEPRFARQAVWRDPRFLTVPGFDPQNITLVQRPSMKTLYLRGLRYLSPPLWFVLRGAGPEGRELAPTLYARLARTAGLHLLPFNLERSGAPPTGWYMQRLQSAVRTDGDVFRVLEALAVRVGVAGVLSDWPATVTYFANCFGL